MDYEKHVNSQFVRHLLAYTRRTNKAIGITQDGNFEQGLISLRAALTGSEMDEPDYWQSLIADCLAKIESLQRLAEAGNIEDRQGAIDLGAELRALATMAHHQRELLNG